MLSTLAEAAVHVHEAITTTEAKAGNAAAVRGDA